MILQKKFNEACDLFESSNRSVEKFSDIAADILAGFDESCIHELIQIFNQQRGDQIMRLFESDALTINIHHWPDQITNCHCHEFSGAFRVIQGQALHVKWKFHPAKKILDSVEVGQLIMDSRKIIDSNVVEKIYPGRENLIHQLIYLQRPAYSVVLRTKKIPGYQMDDFYYPGLCVNTTDAIEKFILDLQACSHFEAICELVKRSTPDMILKVYAGSVVSYHPILKERFQDLQDFIESKFSQEDWFQEFRKHWKSHSVLIQKTLFLEQGSPKA
jgi:hypothetical protein